MNAGAAKLAGQAVQKAFPFMKDAALKSGKADQTWYQMMKMAEMTDAGPTGPAPWSNVLKTLGPSHRDYPLGPNAFANRMSHRNAIEFSIEKPGHRGIGGTMGPGHAPDETHLQYLGSPDSGRYGTGVNPFVQFVMDISSPAQRELPLRGLKLDPAQKAARAPRPREDRRAFGREDAMGNITEKLPLVPMAEKQSAIDALMRLLRGSGIKKMSFEAEPGERQRLYEYMTGFKARPAEGSKTEQINRVRSFFPGRQDQPAYSQPFGPEVATPNRNFTPEGLERALGLSIAEAVDMGLARSAGAQNVFRLTPEGVQAAANWLGGTPY